jgi:transposase InsO family protein
MDDSEEHDFYEQWQGKKRYMDGKPADLRLKAATYVNQQTYWQLYNARHVQLWMPIIARQDWSWQSDSMFYPSNGKMRAIFCAIEMTRKLGFVRVYRGASPDATQCADFLRELRDKYPINFLGTDPGSEYKNSSVKSWAAEHDIELYFYETKDLRPKAIVERFNKTVRMILLWWTYNKSKSWVTALPKLIDDEYNKRVHSSTKLAPDSVSDIDSQRLRAEKLKKAAPYFDKLHDLHPGDRVRIYYKVDPSIPANQLMFRKLDTTWSTKVYTISKLEGYRVILEGLSKRFSVSDLQRISGAENEAVPKGISEVARKRKGHRAAELREIDAVIPSRELAALIPAEMELRPKAKRAIAAPRPARAAPVVEVNEELVPVSKTVGDLLHVSVLGYEFRTGKAADRARFGLWFHVKYDDGSARWEKVNRYLVPVYKARKSKGRRVKEGDNVMSPVGEFWNPLNKKHADERLIQIWNHELFPE